MSLGISLSPNSASNSASLVTSDLLGFLELVEAQQSKRTRLFQALVSCRSGKERGLGLEHVFKDRTLSLNYALRRWSKEDLNFISRFHGISDCFRGGPN